MPVYNAERFLADSVGSVLAQTFDRFELICFNDASTDNSSSLLHQYAATDSRVKVIDSPVNVKQGAGRNRAIQIAKGRFVMFLDADDRLDIDALRLCHDAIDNRDADAVFFDYAPFTEDGLQQTVSPLGQDAAHLPPADLRRLISSRPTSIWLMMVSKALIVDNDLYFREGVFYEDNAVALAIQLSARHPVKINHTLYHYRTDNASVTRSTDNFRFFDRIDSATTLLHHLQRLGIRDEFPEEIDFVIINQYLVHTVYGSIYRFSKVQTCRIKQVLRGMDSLIPGWRNNRYWKARPLREKIKFATHATMPRLIKLLSNLNRAIHRK